MIKNSIVIACAIAVSFLVGCSNVKLNTNTNENVVPLDTGVESKNDETDVFELNDVVICYRGHYGSIEHIIQGDYDLTKATIRGEIIEPHTMYRISKEGDFSYDNAFDYCDRPNDRIHCQLSEEKVLELFGDITDCQLQEYEIYHSNDDGIMVTEYPDYYIYDVCSDKAYMLSESDYIKILDMLDKVKRSCELN